MLAATVASFANPASFPRDPAIHVRRGKEAVLRSAALLSDFASRCGQAGVMSDITYFVAKPGTLKRTPMLLLMSCDPQVPDQQIEPGHLLGALLLYEYRLSGIRTGLYSSNDRSGRNTLLAAPPLRAAVALYAAQWLQKHGAKVTLLSFRDDAQSVEQAPALFEDVPYRAAWAIRQREIHEFLPLARTYDETLAAIGQRTRSNLRYYRRRTERELGCTFHPELHLGENELLLFNRQCMYPVSDHVAIWRFTTMKSLGDPILMGLRDREGKLLSVLGGRRVGTSSEVLWQMNRRGLPHLSLSLVMRSYFLEHEIGRGAERFYIEGGTGHPIRESFTRAFVTDLAVVRRSPATAAIRKLARYAVKDDNELATMLFDPLLDWRSSPLASKKPHVARISSPASTRQPKRGSTRVRES